MDLENGEGMLGLCPLLRPLEVPAVRLEFISRFFSVSMDMRHYMSYDNGFNAFFVSYHSLCRLAANEEPQLSTLTHQTIVDIAGLIHYQADRTTLAREIIWGNLSGIENTNILIDLATSIYLMKPASFIGKSAFEEISRWVSGPLADWSKRPNYFTIYDRRFPIEDASRESVKLPKSFTAESLQKIGGIEVYWTDNVFDHLLLADDDTKVFLFHHVSYLQTLQKSEKTPYPGEFLSETLRTISLLLPPVLGQPNPFFTSQLKSRSPQHPIDSAAGLVDRLNSSDRRIENFHFWRDRLVLLKRTYDDTEPKTLTQLWLDDRRKGQWFTFWVAVLVFVMTVFFGVLQTAGTWVQAWASVKALHQQ